MISVSSNETHTEAPFISLSFPQRKIWSVKIFYIVQKAWPQETHEFWLGRQWRWITITILWGAWCKARQIEWPLVWVAMLIRWQSFINRIIKVFGLRWLSSRVRKSQNIVSTAPLRRINIVLLILNSWDLTRWRIYLSKLFITGNKPSLEKLFCKWW